ncbi:hypothetical protein GH714_016756 [Hevea brasiliensis]|uniref:RRM domain-containing protein n=1 Tax=Hevea brasiliensis TaxID=3981 RepID=A0A6A6KIV0_HEVBR|nr:hypothetical protein GH714_016756 [Hevea brasiliensis]
MKMELGKLFIGGLSWDTNEDQLREYFQAFGEVVGAVIMKDRATGRARGFGFVVFADPAVAERVVMEKHLIYGRNVEAKKAVPREDQNIVNRNSNSSIHGSAGPARTKKIFVGGLASTVTETDFKKYFDQFGIITDVVVMYDHNTLRPRGFGFITYDSEEAVDKVLHKTFHELNGKMLSQTQEYNTSSAGGFGVRMDGRFSPVTVGQSNFSPFGPGSGMRLNFEPGLSPSYGGNSNINLGYGRLSPSYSGNSSRNGFFWQYWQTLGILSYSGQGGGTGSAYGRGSLSYNWGDFNVGLGGVGYGRNSGTSAALVSSHAASHDDHDVPCADIYDNGLLYGDSAWRSSPLGLEGSGSFGFGLGNAATDGVTKIVAGYTDGYSVANRQANRGIAA